MSRVRLYVDEDAAERAVVSGLRTRGVDVLTVHEAGEESATDDEQLAFATSQGRSLYTLNVGDFSRLHSERLATGARHAGIIVIPRQRYSSGEKIRQLMALIESTTAEEMQNRLAFL